MIYQHTVILPMYDRFKEKYYDIMEFDRYFNDNFVSNGFELINVQILEYDKNNDTMEYIFWVK
jgi:hypothetical protein